MSEGEGGLKRRKKYALVKGRIFFVNLLLVVVALIIFQIQFSRPLAFFIGKTYNNYYIIRLVFAAAFFTYLYLVQLPLRMIGTMRGHPIWGHTTRVKRGQKSECRN